MAENFSFFDPVEVAPGVWDREYFAQQFTDYFRRLVTTGVMKGESGELKVSTEGNSMITTLSTGVAYVVGRSYENTSPLPHTHDTEVLGKNRIDRIVVRLDLRTESRFVKSFIKKGVASTNPVPPDLQRDQFIYEISLAQVKVIGGQTYINVADVKDERGKTDICPWAGSKILPSFDDNALANHMKDYKEHIPFVVTTKSGYVYKVNLDGVTSYIDGLSLAIKIDEDSNGSMYLNINDLGSKNIYLPNGLFAKSGDLKKDVIYTLRYSSNFNNSGGFILQGGGITLNNTLTSPSTTEAATAQTVFILNNKLNSDMLALGGGSSVGRLGGVALGNAVFTSSSGVAIGNNANASSGVSIGDRAKSGQESVAIGYNVTANGVDCIAIGDGTHADQGQSVAIGFGVTPSMSSDAKLGVSKNAYGPWNWLIPGQLYVSSTKNFAVMHPKPEKRATHEIRHGAVESPTTGDTLYRYSIKIDGETKKAKVMLFGENNEVELPVTEQQDGTYLISIILPDYWIYLNVNEQVFVNADKHFGLGFGEINRETETLELTLNTLKDYNVALFGTRNDENVQDWYIMGVEREIGVSWEGETSMIEETEILNVYEIKNDEVL